MKKLLKYLRRKPWINRPLRFLFRKMGPYGRKFAIRWPVAGVVSLKFENIPFRIYSEGDDHTANKLYYNERYTEHNDIKLFLSLAKRSSVILDIGANTGLYSILSDKVAPQAKLFSFEPSPSNVKRLRMNFALNNTRAEVVDQAIGDKQSVVDFFVPVDDSISDTSSAAESFSKYTYGGKIDWKAISVQQTTLDNFAAQHHIERIDLMKIDVEGYEEAVFKGAESILEKNRPIIQCEIFLDESRKLFFDSVLKKYNYIAYMIQPDGLLCIDQEMQANSSNLNYLFATGRTSRTFSPFTDMEEIAKELVPALQQDFQRIK